MKRKGKEEEYLISSDGTGHKDWNGTSCSASDQEKNSFPQKLGARFTAPLLRTLSKNLFCPEVNSYKVLRLQSYRAKVPSGQRFCEI